MQKQAKKGLYMTLKAVLDFVFALMLLVLFGPFLLLVSLIIRLDSPGPAIYCQTRVGRCGKLFTIYKFRTMRVGTPVLSTADMQRQSSKPFTRLGPLLRKTNIDELPQLLNILKGEMSFIGPRPALPSQTDVVGLREECHADCVRPGITGLAQVMGRDDLETGPKVAYDSQYCNNISLWMDLSILFKTFNAVVSARGNK